MGLLHWSMAVYGDEAVQWVAVEWETTLVLPARAS